MGSQLPERPDLGQLRRQAKDLQRAANGGEAGALARIIAVLPATSSGERVPLAAAQLAIAREHGFTSWPRLKTVTELLGMGPADRVDAFLEASVGNGQARAARMLADNPGLATHDFRTALVLGDAARVHQLLKNRPELAHRPDARSGWPPLLGVCSSRWHQIDPAREEGLLAVARILLDAGADPMTSVGERGERVHCSALFGAAGTANNPSITQLLLERGARVDDHTVYLAAFHRDHRCLRLLLDHGADWAQSTALAAPISQRDVEGVRLLLAAGLNPRRPLPAELLGEAYTDRPPVNPVGAAIEFDCSAELVESLLAAGADPDAPGLSGRSPHQTATAHGRYELLDMLARHRAQDDSSELDAALGALATADRPKIDQLLTADPGMPGRFTAADQAILCRAADRGDAEAVRLMLDIGFPVALRSTDDDGATVLHLAAAAGSDQVVRLLLARGADLEATDTTWDSTPLVWASVGSGLHLGHNPSPDWVATVQTLLDAGADTRNARPGPGKAPSDDVAALLLAHGIYPLDDNDD
ncbi:MAG: ankyrin repeat domain-containing protein [Pseudonocardiaceae bacterium]